VDSGVANKDVTETMQSCPAASAAQGRGIRGWLAGVEEPVGETVGQQRPAGGKITGRVSGAHVAEVDHATDGAV
jgi:hypothetical protein